MLILTFEFYTIKCIIRQIKVIDGKKMHGENMKLIFLKQFWINYKNTRETGYIMRIECLAIDYQGL